MAQDTTWTGAVLTEADINAKLMQENGAWTTYVPAVVQSGAVAVTVNRASYGRAGRFIYGDVCVRPSAAGTANNAVTVSTPVTMITPATQDTVVGSGLIFDLSANLYYPQIVVLKTSTTFAFIASDVASNVFTGMTGSTFAAALANNDSIIFHFQCEAAS